MKKWLLGMLAALLWTALGAGAQTLPPGFSDVTVVSGLSAPTALAFAPDGRLFICEQGGDILIYKQGQLLPTPFLHLNVSSDSERGVLGIAFDPGFAINSDVYIYYTTNASSLAPPPTPKNRVSRFTANGDVGDLASETIVISDIPSDAGNHNAGCLRFGADNKLYIATGDGGAVHTNSQDLSSLAGKLLRLNTDGTIPPDNPFYNQTGKRGEIYCYGLRNPFRFAFKPNTSIPFIGDVGENTWEEVDVGQPGGNYGWPTYEGPTNVSGFISPIYAYMHTSVSAAIIGGRFFTSTRYPSQYRGSYFFGDYIRNVIRRLTINSDNTLRQDYDFDTSAPTPVDFAQGPDGNLYYVSISDGAVHKIVYAGADADFNADGQSDLVFQNSGTGQVALWYMNSITVIGGGPTSLAPRANWQVKGVGDFNGDGKPDIVFQNSVTGQIAFWFMDGQKVLGGAFASLVPASGYQLVGVGDFNGDGKPDLLFYDPQTYHIAVWYMNGTTVSGGASINAPPAVGYRAVGVGDFNGDGKPDIVFQNNVSGQIIFTYLDGTTVLGGGNTQLTPLPNWNAVAVGDYNNDGQADLVFQNSTTGQVVFWFMNGTTVIGGAMASQTPSAGYQIVGPR